MSDFILWNLIFAIAYLAYKCVGYMLPKHITFAVLDARESTPYGAVGTVLINERRHKVHKPGPLWRYQKDGACVCEEWAEKLDLFLANRS